MSNAPFPIDAHQTAISIAYQNKRLISDEVLPRIQVGKQEFKYMQHDLAESFTVSDTNVGRKSKPNEVSFGMSEVLDSTEDFALDDPIPNSDIENAPENHDPLGNSTQILTNLIMLDREIRVANMVFDSVNYPAANKKAFVDPLNQWDDYINSDPLTDLMTALDVPIIRPNLMTIGRDAYNKLRMHPLIIKAVNGTSGDVGVAARKALADLLEIDAVLVGEGVVNTAHKGQTPNLQRVWGKHCSLTYRDDLATANSGATFGFTAQWGDRISGAIPDDDIGMRGGVKNRVGESVKELITAPDLAYFLQNVVS